MTFRVLYVCTANICRSAMAERLMQAALPPGVPVAVASAGVKPLVGHDMERASAAAIRELGARPDGHVARRVTADEIEGSDLVLTATSDHRGKVVQLAPLAFRRVFTIREFARLASHLDTPPPSPTEVDALRLRVREVAALRGAVDAPPTGLDDVGDPFGGPYDQMVACAAMINATVRDSLAALGLTTTTVSAASPRPRPRPRPRPSPR